MKYKHFEKEIYNYAEGKKISAAFLKALEEDPALWRYAQTLRDDMMLMENVDDAISYKRALPEERIVFSLTRKGFEIIQQAGFSVLTPAFARGTHSSTRLISETIEIQKTDSTHFTLIIFSVKNHCALWQKKRRIYEKHGAAENLRITNLEKGKYHLIVDKKEIPIHCS